MTSACVVLALAVPTVLVGQSEPQAPRFPRIEQVGKAVWAALQPEAARFNDSNSVVIALPEGVLLVDTQADPEATERLLQWIGRELGKPVRWLINTHWHVDHVASNGLVAERHPGVTLIGHESLLADVPERAAGLLADDARALGERIARAEEQLENGLGISGQQLDAEQQEQQRRGIDAAKDRRAQMQETKLVAPALGYAERLRFASEDAASGPVEVFSVVAHTDGDSILWLPRERVLITGDVLDALPFGGHGHPRRWLEVLGELAALDPEVVVPGHGPVYRGAITTAVAKTNETSETNETSQRTPREHIQLVRRLFARLLELVDEAQERGVELEPFLETLLDDPQLRDVRAELASDAVAERAFDQFVPATARRAWEQTSAAARPD